jgi:hypothetical protein
VIGHYLAIRAEIFLTGGAHYAVLGHMLGSLLCDGLAVLILSRIVDSFFRLKDEGSFAFVIRTLDHHAAFHLDL